MRRAPRIRLTSDKIAALLKDRPVETVQRGSLPRRGESYPVTLQEDTELRVIVADSKLLPRTQNAWNVTVVVDRSEPQMLLNAESGGGIITPLGESRAENEPEAHGYSENPSSALDAGAGVPHADVMDTAESRAAAERWADSRVSQIAHRRAKSLAKRLEGVLVQATVHGADVSEQVDAISEQIDGIVEATKRAA